MKRIEAVIRPEKIDSVRQTLEKVGYTGLMITEIEGHGRQRGVTQQWRGEKYKVDFLPKIKLEMIVKNGDVERIVKSIIDNAKTGEIGDGKIFISSVDDVVRIRTGEKGESAI